MDEYTRKMMQVAVAQTCLNVGWSAIQTSPLEIMTDLLSDYILGICKRANNYAQLYNQTEPNLDHLGLAFEDFKISIPDLEEYVTYFENNNCPEVPQYPIVKESNWNFLKPGSREVVTRPVHVHEHLPPMYPQLEEQESTGISKLSTENSPPPPEIAAATSNDTPSTPSPSSGFKRRSELSAESAVLRRARALAEEESRPLREISSVMMTTSGFLSHAREGKLPEVRTIPMNEPEPEDSPEEPPVAPMNPEIKVEQPEVKQEKKRKKKVHDLKKAEKEPKIKEDPVGQVAITPVSIKSELFPDDSQVKKLVTVKETSKLKVLKPGATKAIALMPDSSTSTPKSEKKNKKRPHSPGAAMNPTGQGRTKVSKIDKSQAKERIIVDDTANDAFPSFKLTTEPDKQKLNIFKKISKVKDDYEEPKSASHEHIKQGKDIVIIEPLKKASAFSTVVEPIKEDKNLEPPVDIENIHSPSAYGSMSFGEEFMAETPKTPKTPDIPKVASDSKKKKRDKHKDKKERERFNSSPVSSRTSDENLSAKPKTPEVTVDSPDDNLPFPFLSYPTGPALIPPNLASNPLIPQMNVMPFPPKIPPLPMIHMLAAQPPPTPPPQNLNVPVSPLVLSSTPPSQVSPIKVETPPTPASRKKDKKDKKNKDKIKKKKDKKDKLKAKDKSERKKLKLHKKQKLQEKLKLKREKKVKKKEAQKEEEKRGDSPSVPKITFKLGPEPQQEQSPNPKITIKPVIKKEEDVIEAPKKHALEPVATPTTKHHKGSLKAAKSATITAEASHHAKVLELAKSGVSLTIASPPPRPAPPVAFKTEADDSNQLWICPACGRPDDGSPMIACDACDMWYHYVCVGILEAPESDWFCQGCISKKPDLVDKKKKHKKRK